MSSVQFNLLPDVKMEHVKVQKTQALLVTISIIAAVASAAIFILTFFTANVIQKSQLSNSEKDLKKYTAELRSKPNVERIVTVQNQLKSLVGLHQSKHITARLFSYLPSLTPTSVHISNIGLDLTASTMVVDGTSDDGHQSINTFIDTLKFTTFKTGADSSAKNAFTNVVETSFSINPEKGGADYTVTTQFDPALFINSNEESTPKLNVPKLTSTRSVVHDPANLLFNGSIKPTEKSGN